MLHHIPVDLLNFPNRYPLHVEVDVGREELFHAAITTGKGGDLLGISLPFSVGELVWKLGILDGCIEFDSAGRLSIELGVSHLDPSEKAALAHILSNAQTGLVANRVLGATHVLHLKAFARGRYTRNQDEATIPDFVAIDSRSLNTFVIETKGTVGAKVDAAAERKAIRQLGTRISLTGYRNTLRFAHYSEFPHGAWKARLQYESGRSVTVGSTDGRAFYAYYAPLVDLLRQLSSTSNRNLGSQYTWAEIERVGIAFGVWTPVVDAIDALTAQLQAGASRGRTAIDIFSRGRGDGAFNELAAVARESSRKNLNSEGTENAYAGSDGVIVRSTTEAADLR